MKTNVNGERPSAIPPTETGDVAVKAINLPRVDFHIAEGLVAPPKPRVSACLLIGEDSGEIVAEFPNSPQGIDHCVAVVKRVNSHDALVAAARSVIDWYEGRSQNLPEVRTAMYEQARAALALVEAGQ